MTLGATFSSLTQKQIDAEKQANKSVENATATATEAKSTATKVSESVESLNETVEEIQQVISEQPSTYVKTTVFEEYQKNVEETYVKTDDLDNYVKTSKAEETYRKVEDSYTKDEVYSKEEIDALISELKGDN